MTELRARRIGTIFIAGGVAAARHPMENAQPDAHKPV
jgi:hypothetical protein